MKRILIFWFFFGVVFNARSQTMTITNEATGEPIEIVFLLSENPRVYASTNNAGQVDISAFKDSEEIAFRALGYKTVIKSYNSLSSSSFALAMTPSVFDLDGVVVSATRWNQTSQNVPSKVITITPENVVLQNPQTAADLLGISGKVFIQKSQQGGGSPMIRGFATNRLLYTVDGVRMNTAIFRGGNLQNVINIDPFATESTEVLFGSGSVIYGSDAIGGVMSFQTLTPQFSLTESPLIKGKAVTRYSSANREQTGHLDVNVGWKKWAMVTSFSSWDFDDLRQGSHGPDDYVKNVYAQRQDSVDVVITQQDPLLQIPSAYSQINLMQKVRFSPNENWDLQYGFHYSTTSQYGRYDRHNRFRNGTLRYGEWNYGPQQWMMNNINIKHMGNNTLYDQLTIRLAQQSFEESRIDRLLNEKERNITKENVQAYSLNLDLVKSTSSKNTLYYGIEYVLNDIDSRGSLTDIEIGLKEIGPSVYPNSKWKSMAIYLNDEYKISDRTTLQGGLRYNQYKLDADFNNNLEFYPFPFTNANINDGALTGSFGGVYRPGDRWLIKANFSTAFRSPNVDDIGKVFDSEPGAVTVPNPDLKAEYAYNLDLGVAKVISDVVKIDLTGYYTLLSNALVRRNFQLNGLDSILYDGEMSQVQAIQNAAKANVYGVQAGIEVKLKQGLMFMSDLNYQIGEEELDDGTTSASRHAAPFFGVTRVRYSHDDLVLELNAMYQSERSFADLAEEERGKDEIYAKDINGNNFAPAWYTLNLKSSYRLTDNLRMSGGIENLTDQRYRPYSSGISGAGRNFVLSLTAQL